MSWTWPVDLRAQLQKWWDQGLILASLVEEEAFFPKQLSFKRPRSSELLPCFDEVRDWSRALRAMPHIRLEMHEWRHPVLGLNAIPQAVWVDSLEAAIALIDKKAQTRTFKKLIDLTRSHQPALVPWLIKRPLKALILAELWPQLLAVVDWMKVHPKPGIYVRQLDLPQIHSKWIESHQAVLSELLDLVLSPEAINTAFSGTAHFAKRYGFLEKPQRIRFRCLDPTQALLPGNSSLDLTLDADSFSRLVCEVSVVFMTENEINFLAFPPVKAGMVIFGAGYGFEGLNSARWLKDCQMYYWGDIDTHGFAILDELRSHFDHVHSFLMDDKTFKTFESQWGYEEKPTRRDLKRLSVEEQALYNALRDNRMGKQLRLEQEKVSFGYMMKALSKRCDSGALGSKNKI